ncbi:hypothetical protein HN371_16310 [Candidatus Poribacteria bacterium]|jgi:hypothetical protein|nr:hypothetical protein [Candidatus Poribacteria bacterium]MBT5533200.1 hypothetical protein [Candidatus Poribacteria bacterium]MBT5712671.1 hypothetical protein [Candidatus Poribacteria bacterium]MBT7097749.1 hypothetical protein [Candidatus Poribacteria bacterium]MBT7808253.1 hypothetical protein [Candidatus Poribacteria bacterium]
MTPSKPRTPIPRAILGTFGILTRPALAGWILRALGMLLLGILPLAAISTYGAIPLESRLAFAGAVLVAGAAGGALYAAGAWLRRRGR